MKPLFTLLLAFAALAGGAQTKATDDNPSILIGNSEGVNLKGSAYTPLTGTEIDTILKYGWMNDHLENNKPFATTMPLQTVHAEPRTDTLKCYFNELIEAEHPYAVWRRGYAVKSTEKPASYLYEDKSPVKNPVILSIERK